MPIYQYVCECGVAYEKLRSVSRMKEPVLCSSCGKNAQFRVAVPAQFQRGPQWNSKMMDHDAGKPGRSG